MNLARFGSRIQSKIQQLQYFSTIPRLQDKLFTPGPLLTTMRVKESMLYDYGSRDPQFIKIIQDVRQQLLDISHVNSNEYQTILMQGSGTFGIESTLHSTISKENTKLLVVSNGAYGERMAKIANLLGINNQILKYVDNEVVKPSEVLAKVKEDPKITHIGMIHSETTAGIINPVQEVGPMLKNFNPNLTLIIDAMSSFGAYDINIKTWGIDYLVSTSNKNIQGVPGFAFIIASLEKFVKCKGNARSLALDAYDQWQNMEATKQFRFTPPTHVIKAFKTALDEFIERGGALARNKRYSENQQYMSQKLEEMGFKLYIDKSCQGCIITTFLQPSNQSNWNFEEFYEFLSKKNLIIYPGKLTQAKSFRIGSIGELYREDFVKIVDTIKEYLNEKKISIPVQY